MLNIKVPATSANLGPGFDTLGIALNLYNEYEVKLSDTLKLINVLDEFNNQDNLFYKTYKKITNKYNINNEIHVNFKNINIPISRGLGSSSATIIASIIAANELNNLHISKEEMLELATEIEGHPDNVAPCLYGGLTISSIDKSNNIIRVIIKKINISSNIYFTIIIPPYKTNTDEARKILPKDIPLSKAIENVSHSLLLINALENNDLNNLNIYMNDNFHVPYRKNLIKDYDYIKNLSLQNGAKGFTISGSGSSMLIISDTNCFSKKIILNDDYKIIDLNVDNIGAVVM